MKSNHTHKNPTQVKKLYIKIISSLGNKDNHTDKKIYTEIK